MIVIKAKPAVHIGTEVKYQDEYWHVTYIGEQILIIENIESHHRMTLWKNMIEIKEE